MALYNFTDTSNYNPGMNIPGEAVSIGGVVLENEIDGYRTLFVKGRESLSAEIKSTERGADGSVYHGKRYPERVITVGFQMLAKTDTDYRNKFNKLAQLLNVEQVQIIFNDEPDKFFIGTPGEVGEIEPGRNKVTGEFQIVCADPFKYSVDLKEVTTKNTTIYYNGSFPADYIIEGKAGADANIRWLSFCMNDNSIVLGDLDVADDSSKYSTLEQDLNPGTLSVTSYSETFDDTADAWRYIAQFDAPDASKISKFDIKMQTAGTNGTTTRIVKDYAGLRVRFARGSRVVGEYYFTIEEFFPATVSVFYDGYYLTFRVNDVSAREYTPNEWTEDATSCTVQVVSKSDITLTSPLIRFFNDDTTEAYENYKHAPNKFIEGDTFKVDTARRAVYVDGVLRPDLNYLSNMWDIQLQPGENTTYINGAGGTVTDYVLKYREKWL